MECKNDLEREFYIRMARKFGWSKNVLMTRLRTRPTKKRFSIRPILTRQPPKNIRNQAKLAVKDDYTFDFLELGEEHSERQS